VFAATRRAAPVSEVQGGGGQTKGDDNSASGAVGAPLSASAAVSLVRMNEDYFDLDLDIPQQLLIASVNESDPTRMPAPNGKRNEFLLNLCAGISNLEDVARTEKELLLLEREVVRPARGVTPDRTPTAVVGTGLPTGNSAQPKAEPSHSPDSVPPKQPQS
jgi:hypothetical protein